MAWLIVVHSKQRRVVKPWLNRSLVVIARL